MEPRSSEIPIAPECRRIIREEIEAVGGSEVFFVGRLDRDLVVEEVEAYAFGNRTTVPALLQYARPGEVILHNHPSGNLEPSGADIEISSLAGERGIGSYIIDNACESIRIVVKAMRPREVRPLDSEALAWTLSPEGPMTGALDQYEERPSQIEMLKATAAAFNADEIAIIEAPTGTGKSLAYLIPAIEWSLANQEKVVISTETINLQEQLIERDIPLIARALDSKVEAVLVKGRSNYLCRRKADYLAKHRDFGDAEETQEQIDNILDWIPETKDGSLADLGFQPAPDVWERVVSESDNCLRARCPFYHKCFYYEAKRRAARANILVVNHHLLLADLALRAETENYSQPAVLPVFHRLIVDEAHGLEDIATQYFGGRVSRQGLMTLVRRLASAKTGEGLLSFLARKIHDATYPLDADRAKSWLLRLSREAGEAVAELRSAIDEACERTAIVLERTSEGTRPEGREFKWRVKPEWLASEAGKREVEQPLLDVVRAGRNVLDILGELHRDLKASVEEETTELMTPLMELRAILRRLERHLTRIIEFLNESAENCKWIEVPRRRGRATPNVAFCSAPLDVSTELRNQLLKRYPTLILTSATLTVRREFDYFLGRIGATPAPQDRRPRLEEVEIDIERDLLNERIRTIRLDSPFDFSNQVFVGVPVDLPDPNQPSFTDALCDFMLKALQATRGRGLVLFTSYALLTRAYERVAPQLEREGIMCLKQGSANRTFLTKAFREDVGSVLFATSSFWQGVDLPGETLSCVILTRLPFAVPTEPVLEARVEALKAQGRDPFSSLIVPRAVIRFRQGFGRLIRRRSDRGVVLVCDARVARAAYGRTFLSSLPVDDIDLSRSELIIERIRTFFGSAVAG